MSHVQNDKLPLAQEMAEAFKEESKVEQYQDIFQKYDLDVISRAFAEAKEVPADRIKKSRHALFLYLLKKYAKR